MPTYLDHTDRAADEVLAVIRAEGFALDDPHRSVRTVLDTFDGRLHAAGLRLELRDGPSRELVLTGPGDSPPAHVDWDRSAPRTGDELPPGPFGARIARVIVERALLAVAEVSSTSHRAVRRDRRGKPVVTLTVHQDVRLASAPADLMPGLVVEEVTTLGHERDADAATSMLVGLGLDPGPGDLVDVVVRSTGRSLAGHAHSPAVPLRREEDAEGAFRAVLRNLLTEILDNLPGTLADLDPEFLHDLRVALRRTRSVLAEGKKVLPGHVRERYRADFAELAAATSATRDLDVYLLAWSDLVAPLGLDDVSVTAPVVEELRSRRRAAHAAMCDVLRSDTTRHLLESWQAWLEGADARGGAGTAPIAIGRYVASRIEKAQAGLLRDGRAITVTSPAERLHDLRKDAKKLRYLFECFAALLPDKARKAFVGHLKALQDNLGEHQDAEVQVAELRALAHDLHAGDGIDTGALLAVGRIIDSLERVRQRERDAFAHRFAEYDTPANQALLDTLLAEAAAP